MEGNKENQTSLFEIAYSCASSEFISPISGQIRAIPNTTRMVRILPPTTEMIGPNKAAAAPDSKPPNSFDTPMKYY